VNFRCETKKSCDLNFARFSYKGTAILRNLAELLPVLLSEENYCFASCGEVI